MLFLCDIRTVTMKDKTQQVVKARTQHREMQEHREKEVEELVENDMAIQKRMVQETQPEMSVLKLSLPYPVQEYEDNQNFEYLDGTNFFQPFNRNNSTECRLTCVPSNVATYKKECSREAASFTNKIYEVKIHEQRCVFLNIEVRPQWDYKAASKIYVLYREMMYALLLTEEVMTECQYVSHLSEEIILSKCKSSLNY